jgi:FtsZ-binding cell division protein ZapB
LNDIDSESKVSYIDQVIIIGLQKHIDSLKYGSTASLHVSASSYETQDLKTENEKLKRHLQAYENQIKDLESELS